MGLDELRQRGAASVREGLLLGEALGAPLLLGLVADVVLVGEVAFEELNQIVGEAKKVRLHLFRGGGTGPGALGSEFVFEFVEDFFQIPAAEIQKGDHPGGQSQLTGKKLVDLPGGGVRVADPPQSDAFAGLDDFIGRDAGGVGVLGIEGERAEHRQVHLGFGQGDEIDTAALLPFLPLGIVNRSAVVGVDHFAAGRGVLAQGSQREPLKCVHVVLFFPLSVREVVERLRAQIESEEVAGGAFAPVDRRVMHGGPVPVAIGGVEVKIPETLQMREGIVDQQSGDVGAGLLAERQTTLAFEGLEKMAPLRTLRPLRANLLEERAPADLIMQCPHRAQGQPGLVRQRGAVAEGGAFRGQIGERSQERGLNRGGRRSHNGAQKNYSPDQQD